MFLGISRTGTVVWPYKRSFGPFSHSCTQNRQAWEWIKFCASKKGMQLTIPTPNTTPARRSMVNESFYRGVGPAHWKVFYDTLDAFPDSAPIPAPPQQAAVETALIKNVVSAITQGPDGVRPGLATMQRDLELALKGR